MQSLPHTTVKVSALSTPFPGSQFSSLRGLFTLSSLLFCSTLMNAFEHFIMVDQLSAPDRLFVCD
jgi:hypothetical protein